MLITFNSKAWSNVTLPGDVATTLLKMMGHSGTVPGSLPADLIPAAMGRLREALAFNGAGEQSKQGTRPAPADAVVPIPEELGLIAYPLIRLLWVAAQKNCDVIWNVEAQEFNPLFSKGDLLETNSAHRSR